MASMDNAWQTCDEKNVCNYCRKKLTISKTLKCINCESLYHTSCALRIEGVVVVGRNNLIKCCNDWSEDGWKQSTAFPGNGNSYRKKRVRRKKKKTEKEQLFDKVVERLEESIDCKTERTQELHHTPTTLRGYPAAPKIKKYYITKQTSTLSQNCDVKTNAKLSPTYETEVKNYGLAAEARIRLAESESQIQNDSWSEENPLRYRENRYSFMETPSSSKPIFTPKRNIQKPFIPKRSEKAVPYNPFEEDNNYYNDDELNPFQGEKVDDLNKSNSIPYFSDNPGGSAGEVAISLAEIFIILCIFIVLIFICFVVLSFIITSSVRLVLYIISYVLALYKYIYTMVLVEPEPQEEPLISLKFRGRDIFDVIRNLF